MIKAIIVILSFAVGFLISRDHRRSKAVREATILVKQASKAIQDCNAESQKWHEMYMSERQKGVKALTAPINETDSFVARGYYLITEGQDSFRVVHTP